MCPSAELQLRWVLRIIQRYHISSVIYYFSFQNNPKDLDPSYKTDLDLWDRLGRIKLVLQQNFKGLI